MADGIPPEAFLAGYPDIGSTPDAARIVALPREARLAIALDRD